MPYFLIRHRHVPDPECYWVSASTPAQARRWVARLVPEAADACNTAAFECLRDRTKRPPEGVVYRSRRRDPG